MKRRSEFTLIADLFAPLAHPAPGALDLRDDAALVDITAGCELVVTTDTIIAGVHFRTDDPADTIARKALRVNLSDLAAKGAKPIGILQALTLSAAVDDAFLERYARGLGDDLAAFDVALLGGDTTSHPTGPLTITITALGEVPKGTALLRSGARVGDLVCVSGTLGDAAAGLRELQRLVPLPNEADRAFLVGRYFVPQPRLALGQALRGLATACVDISDGLCADLGHLCRASGVAAELEMRLIPLSGAFQRRMSRDPSLQALALGGGDDYELAFTVPENRRMELDAAAAASTPVTIIGRIVEDTSGSENGVTVRDGDGRPMMIASPGFTHA